MKTPSFSKRNGLTWTLCGSTLLKPIPPTLSRCNAQSRSIMNTNFRKQSQQLILSCLLVAVGFAFSPLVFADTEPDNSSSALLKAESVLNNGGMVIRSRGKTYCLTDKYAAENWNSGLPGGLYAVEPKGLRKIVEIDGEKLWAMAGTLYVSGDSPGADTYKINPVTGKSSLLCSGSIVAWGSDNKTFYYEGFAAQNDKPKFAGIYPFNTETSTIEGSIVDAGNTTKSDCLGVIANKLYYTTTAKDHSVTIYSHDMKSGKSTVLTSHKPEDYDDGEPHDEDEVTKLSSCGEWLIYTIGSYQGTIRIFYGKTFRIKPDGTGKAYLKINTGAEFSTFDHWIMYLENDFHSAEYYMVRPDMSEKKKMQFNGSLITLTSDGWLYYHTPSGDIHRSKMDGSNDTLLLKADKLPNQLVEEGDSYVYTIDVVGDVIYLIAKVSGFRGTHGWRDTVISYSFNRVNVDGTGFQTLSLIPD